MNRVHRAVAGFAFAAFLSTAAAAELCPQNFDSVTAPALPSGWTSSSSGAGTGWQTTTTNVDSTPNAAFAGNPATVGNSFLVSPLTLIDSTNSTITFRHRYATENNFDGGVLEFSLGGGAFQDIVAAGGSFSTGGYNGTISNSFNSPIAGRAAWTGDSGGYVTTVVQLPPSAVGAMTQLRWRMTSDESAAATGWSVDSIVCGAVVNDGNSPGWRYGPAYPIPILDEATTVMDGTLYAFAGVSSGTITTNAYKFDGEQWTAISPLPVALEYPVAVNDGAHIFIIGGAGITGAPTNTLYRYTPSTDTYDTMTPFTTAAWAVGATVVGNKIVKFGGGLASGAGTTNATEIYDIASDSWSPGGDYPFALSFISAFTYGGSVYGAGGLDGTSIVRANVYRYDMAANTWSSATVPNLPEVRWGSATIETPNGVVLAGGYVGGTATANLSSSSVAWNAASNTWQPYDSLLAPRARMTGALFDGTPLVIGGRSEAGGFAGTSEVQIHDRIFANGFDGTD